MMGAFVIEQDWFIKHWGGVTIDRPKSKAHRLFNERVAYHAMMLTGCGIWQIIAERVMKNLKGKSQKYLKALAEECFKCDVKKQGRMHGKTDKNNR